eukprot:GHVS01001309.1.p1 GENE.GHVS01001309.1~~GHVS01001309.1.p1  ORF type:complete len:420 (+),score=30.29 GHVS01001309.1:441-1700(+)
MQVYVFANRQELENDEWELNIPEATCSCENDRRYSLNFIDIPDQYDQIKHMLPSSTGGADSKAAKNAPIVIVATDNTQTVSLIMQAVRDVHTKIVFGSIPLTKEGNRFSRTTRSMTVLRDMFMRVLGKDQSYTSKKLMLAEASWCEYLKASVQDYIPMALSIDVGKDDGYLFFSYGLHDRGNEEVKGMNSHSKAEFAKKKTKQKVIWVFQVVKFGESSAEVENRVWDIFDPKSKDFKGGKPARDGVMRSIEGFKTNKEVKNTRFPPVAEMISEVVPIYGPGEHVWKPLFKSITEPPVPTTVTVGVEGIAGKSVTSSITIVFQHSTRWTPDNGDIVVIQVDRVSLWALNPTRLQLTSTESMKVLVPDFENRDIPISEGVDAKEDTPEYRIAVHRPSQKVGRKRLSSTVLGCVGLGPDGGP